MKKSTPLLLSISLSLSACFTQKKALDRTPESSSHKAASAENPQAKNPYYDWFNKDALHDFIQGISTNAAYKLLRGKKAKEVVVAVIDDGIDIQHEDLAGKIWTNPREIPDNGVDDDHNGFVDDVHGWNFLGNAKGGMLEHDTFEITRLYRKGQAEFAGKSEAQIPNSRKAAFQRYQKRKAEIAQKRLEAQVGLQRLNRIEQVYLKADSIAREKLGTDNYSLQELESDTSSDLGFRRARALLLQLKAGGFKLSELKHTQKRFHHQLNYHYNPNYTAYDSLVKGRTPQGNPNVSGVDPFHGTHVAGIIAADRYNGIGIRGIADKAKLMSVVAVPDGDERDENVAKAINYAVNNGAQIISMSFGKREKTRKDLVDAAIKNAMQHGVLIVHSAGNDAVNTDSIPFYPNRSYKDGGRAPNWIEVGASTQRCDKRLAADFSNYNPRDVDVFAPGSKILSIFPGDRYKVLSGTSMAGPMVTGMAAVIWSYFPKLSAAQVRDVILKSVVQHDLTVYRPAGEPMQPKAVNFETLCRTGGIVNLYKAIRLAEKTKAHR